MAISDRLPVITKGDSIFDKIWAHLLNPTKYPLTPTQEEIKNRWSRVLTLRSEYMTPPQVRTHLMQEFGISESQAYNDVRNSEHFFGNAYKTNQEGYDVIKLQWAEQFLKRAIDKKDLKAEGKALEIIHKLTTNEDAVNFNPEKFENVEVSIQVSPSVEAALIEALKKGSVDFNKVEAEDAEYLEVTE